MTLSPQLNNGFPTRSGSDSRLDSRKAVAQFPRVVTVDREEMGRAWAVGT